MDDWMNHLEDYILVEDAGYFPVLKYFDGINEDGVVVDYILAGTTTYELMSKIRQHYNFEVVHKGRVG